jgi:hypothetical protein
MLFKQYIRYSERTIMKTSNTYLQPLTRIWRASLLCSMLCLSSGVGAEPAAPPPETTPSPASPETVLPPGACPLNSGGPSLLGSKWSLLSVYGTEVPAGLDITMEVGEDQLTGFAGCNDYVAKFKRVGHTGFMMQGIDKKNEGCPVLRPAPGAPTINVGNWEGGYLRTLQRAGSVQQEGNTLHFFNRSGEPSVIFRKKYGEG